MDIAEIHEIRRHRLRALMDLRFNSSPTELAQRLGRSASQVSQWVSGVRAISDESREHIERSCGLPPRWLNVSSRPQAAPAEIEGAAWPFELLSRDEWSALTDLERGYIEGRIAELIKTITANRSKAQADKAA